MSRMAGVVQSMPNADATALSAVYALQIRVLASLACSMEQSAEPNCIGC